MNLRSTRELLKYFRFTLRLVEMSPNRESDPLAANELEFILRHSIAEFEDIVAFRPAPSRDAAPSTG